MVILAHSGSEKRVPLSVFNQEHTKFWAENEVLPLFFSNLIKNSLARVDGIGTQKRHYMKQKQGVIFEFQAKEDSHKWRH